MTVRYEGQAQACFRCTKLHPDHVPPTRCEVVRAGSCNLARPRPVAASLLLLRLRRSPRLERTGQPQLFLPTLRYTHDSHVPHDSRDHSEEDEDFEAQAAVKGG